MKRLNSISWGLVLLVTGLAIGCGGAEEVRENKIPSAKPAEPTAESITEKPLTENSFDMSLQRDPYNDEIVRYLLRNQNGMVVELINVGATVSRVLIPDEQGELTNVVLTFENLEQYQENSPYFGSICGRYANRIAKGKFSIGETEYTLATNNEPNHLHGGVAGVNKKIWQAEEITKPDYVGVEFTYASPDGEEGYPGQLAVKVRYTLNDANELKLEYTATTDKTTVLNLTNHCYWNMAGADSGSVLEQELQLNCSRYIPVDETGIPTGELAPVAGTPMDFTSVHTLGERIAKVAGGYDHCYVLDEGEEEVQLIATLKDAASGRTMEVLTTEPGVQLYTGNFLDGSDAVGGYPKHGAVCLECQHFPDSPNRPDFPTTQLEPRAVYQQTTIHRFTAPGLKAAAKK